MPCRPALGGFGTQAPFAPSPRGQVLQVPHRRFPFFFPPLRSLCLLILVALGFSRFSAAALPALFGRQLARRRDARSSCKVHWPSCPVGAGGIKVPTHPSADGGWDFLGFSSGMLQLFPQRDSFLSTMCPKASERDQIFELDCKAEFLFSLPNRPLLSS